MARTQAKLLSSIWIDPEWLTLSERAKLLYLLALSQPRLTLAGSIDVMPGRWARMLSPTTSEADTEAAADELTAARFVVLDDDEMLLRTFTRHDLAVGAINVNLVKGMWSAWRSIRSPTLRKVMVDNLPESIWNRDGIDRPDEAQKLRSEPQLGLPLRPRSEPSVDLLPAVLLTATTTISGDLPVAPEPVAVPVVVDQEQEARRALRLYADAESVTAENPPRHAAAVGKAAATDGRLDTLRTWIAAGMTPEAAAVQLGRSGPLGPVAAPVGPAEAERIRERARRAEEATHAAIEADRTATPGDHRAHLAAIRGGRS